MSTLSNFVKSLKTARLDLKMGEFENFILEAATVSYTTDFSSNVPFRYSISQSIHRLLVCFPASL